MTPDEIREIGKSLAGKIGEYLPNLDAEKMQEIEVALRIAIPLSELRILAEIAAQLAELNEKASAFVRWEK